jgi:hypothetical protein
VSLGLRLALKQADQAAKYAGQSLALGLGFGRAEQNELVTQESTKTERILRLLKGLRLYHESQKRLASIRKDKYELPEAVNHWQKELSNQRQQWLATIEELTMAGVLKENESQKIKEEFLS